MLLYGRFGAFELKLPFSIAVPLFSETKALSFSASYFGKIGIEPIYALDSQGARETEEVLRSLGKRIVKFENSKPYIENGYEAFEYVSPTDWILRIGCDEVPNLRMIKWCENFLNSGKEAIVSFERYQLIWSGRRFLSATTERFQPERQRQFRLFNRRNVTFDRTIHSPGIRVDNKLPAPAGVSQSTKLAVRNQRRKTSKR